MNIQVRYLSKSGNTKKVAEAIADELGVLAEPITKGISGEVDILFLGGAIYWAGVDNDLKKFILNLDSSVKKVAIFSTTAITKSAYEDIKKLFKTKDIQVMEKEFHCRGEFSKFHRGRPNTEDLKLAAEFAREIVK